ncbi:MAG: cell division protein [Nitrososphaerota archaeon]|nr:cell division protein [Nitrososphaerota archaeon]MDG6940004.1 cell division protein [Nitrososphaerota archaeon]
MLDLFVYQNYYGGSKDVLPLTLAINAAKSDLLGLTSVPKSDRILIGRTMVKGHGVGANPDVGAKIASEDGRSIRRAIAERATHQVDAFLIFLGLGGGTGAGASPVIAKMLKEIYREPVYVLGALPSESEGALYARNAAKSLKALTESADGILLFDNNIWQREGVAIKQSFEQMNAEIVRPLHTIFAAGEATTSGTVGTKVIDASDVINSVEGFAAFGFSGWTKSWGDVLKDAGKRAMMKEKSSLDQLDPANRIFSLVQGAAAGHLSVDCDIKTASKALVVVAGNANEMNREGMDRAKAWIQEMTGGAEVRGGDYPHPRSRELMSSVLFSGLKEVPALQILIERSQIKKPKGKTSRDRLYGALPDVRSSS